MTIYYASSTKGFYLSDIHGDNIPSDKVEITPEKHLELIEGQTEGKIIVIVRGRPVLQDPPVPNAQEQIAFENAGILSQIQTLETTLQPRALRDFVLHEDATRLLDLEDQIQSLRAQLK